MILFITSIVTIVLLIRTSQADVVFEAPELIKKDFLYKLTLTSNSIMSFPMENFVFSFELLKSLEPRLELSVAGIDSPTFINEDYHGFSIEKFSVQTSFIWMYIKFRREAHGMIFRIRYGSAKTDSEKENFYIKNHNYGIIFERNISMLLPYLIIIKMDPEVGEIDLQDKAFISNAVLAGKNGQLSCLASEGLPNPKPVFENYFQLSDVTTSNVNEDVTKLVWKVKFEDHNKQISCRAGNDIKNITIKVYHYMTDVITSPLTVENMLRGSQIRCMGKDGYPPPKTQWIFVSGPVEPNKYYHLLENDTILSINSNATLHSNWTFECRGSMVMSTVLTKYLPTPTPIYPIVRMYNFSIIGPDKLDDSPVTSASSNAGLIVVLIILLIVIICVAVLGVKHKEKVQQFINDKRQRFLNRPEQLSKPSVKAVDSRYKYTGVEKIDPQINGNEGKYEPTSYSVKTVPSAESGGPVNPV